MLLHAHGAFCASLGAATPSARRQTRSGATMVLLHPLVRKRSHGAVRPSGVTWKGAATLLTFVCRGAVWCMQADTKERYHGAVTPSGK